MDNDRLQKIIESCHVNFLIGSGASRKYLDTLWNIENLLTALDSETERNTDAFKILETSIRYWYFDKCIRGNLKLRFPQFNLSESKQREYEETVAQYQNFIQALNITLLKRKTSLLNKQINLFTTNMDIFLDVVLDDLGIEFNDGFSGKFMCLFKTSNYQKTIFKSSSQYDLTSEVPLFNLFKLHGSLIWSKGIDGKITYDSNLQTLTDLDRITLSSVDLLSLTSKNSDGIQYKSFQTLKEEAACIAIKNHDEFAAFKHEFEKLLIINPTKEKFESTTLKLEYYEQMRMYSNILEKENSVLFVTGFSFADEHIREITLRALNSNPTLLVCVFCYDEKDKMNIDQLLSPLKFNNLYSDFVDYSFRKTVNEIFASIANNLDSDYKKSGEHSNTINKTRDDEAR